MFARPSGNSTTLTLISVAGAAVVILIRRKLLTAAECERGDPDGGSGAPADSSTLSISDAYKRATRLLGSTTSALEKVSGRLREWLVSAGEASGLGRTLSESHNALATLAHKHPNASVAAASAAAIGAVIFLVQFSQRNKSIGQKTVGVIPARYASSRFHGKPLAKIMGKPMIQWTWEQAMKAKSLDLVVIATDDERVASCCASFGATVIMTSRGCRNGTERCAEALQNLPESSSFTWLVNIQGDEPMLDPATVDALVEGMKSSAAHSPPTSCPVACTAVSSITSSELARDPNRVKCVVDSSGSALLFSRSPIPFYPPPSSNHSSANSLASPTKSQHQKPPATSNPNPKSLPYLLHLGVTCFDARFLSSTYPMLPAGRLEALEDVEHLRLLEAGLKVKVLRVQHAVHGVDVPADVDRVEKEMIARGWA